MTQQQSSTVSNQATIISDPDILGGTPAFAGSRVPFSYLMEYLEKGSTVVQFVEDYPSVSLELATKALEEASQLVDAAVYARPA